MRMRVGPLLCMVSMGCSNSLEPELDPEPGAATLAAVDASHGDINLAYSHDMQGETKPCG